MKGAFYLILTLFVVSLSRGHAQPIRVEAGPTGPTVSNAGTLPVVGLRVGAESVGRLAVGSTKPLAAVPVPTDIQGRFAPAEWGPALDHLDEVWAPYHLRTVGHFLDAVAPGPAGQPDQSANIKALRAVTPDVVLAWPVNAPLQIGLLARAAEFAPMALVTRLLALTQPSVPSVAWPAAYADLPTTVDSVRRAIERHGVEALPAVLAHDGWAQDRGFADRRLALAFDQIRSTASKWLGHSSVVIEPTTRTARVHQLAAAFERGEQGMTIGLAFDLLFSKFTPRQVFDSGVEQRLICAALDGGARRAMKRRQWLASYAYLILAVGPCGESPSIRSRIAELFRHRGDEAFERLRLTDALAWYQGGFWFAREAADRIRLADTNAELAILRFREEDIDRAGAYLDAARTFDPLRPRVIEAGRFRPTSSPQARFGVLVIILFLGFYAIRRLKRALVGDLSRSR
ncbi:MAG: hypothetical protein VX589_12400 [Myxococcota bacterium]|nr:hypothetical protein [Myxococcota bacterium]